MRNLKLFGFLALLPFAAFAGTDQLIWTQPTQCVDGTLAATFCPATGYLVETAPTLTPTASTVWTALTTTPATASSFTVLNVLPGPHAYRITTQSAGGPSVPSNPAFKVTSPAPNPPTGLTVAMTAPTVYKMRQAIDGYSMVAIGTAPLGTPCVGTHYCDGLYPIPRSAVVMASRFDTLPLVTFAQCG